MNKYQVSLAGHGFEAFQRGEDPLPDVVTLKDIQATFEGGDVVERGGRKIRNPRTLAGSRVWRTKLEVEAHSEAEAEGVYKRVLGINSTSAEFSVAPSAPSAVAVLEEPKGKRAK